MKKDSKNFKIFDLITKTINVYKHVNFNEAQSDTNNVLSYIFLNDNNKDK